MINNRTNCRSAISDLRARIEQIQRGKKSTRLEFIPPSVIRTGITELDSHLPDGGLTLGALHEITIPTPADTAAATSFCMSLLSSLLQTRKGIALWCQNSDMLDTGEIYPPCLIQHGITPDRLIFLRLKRDDDILWAMEEALHSHGPACVLGEIAHTNLTKTRRLQTAANEADLPAIILHPGWQGTWNSAAATRWRIKTNQSRPYGLAKTLNEPGNPLWQVELYRCRRGAPGIWKMEFENEKGNLSLAAPASNGPDNSCSADIA